MSRKMGENLVIGSALLDYMTALTNIAVELVKGSMGLFVKAFRRISSAYRCSIKKQHPTHIPLMNVCIKVMLQWQRGS